MNPWDAFDSPTEAAFADIDVALLGWGLGDCHMIYVRGQDAAGNWGPPGSFEECTPLLLTPIPPVVSSVLLAGPMFGDIEITWKASPDEGGGRHHAGGQVHAPDCVSGLEPRVGPNRPLGPRPDGRPPDAGLEHGPDIRRRRPRRSLEGSPGRRLFGL